MNEERPNSSPKRNLVRWIDRFTNFPHPFGQRTLRRFILPVGTPTERECRKETPLSLHDTSTIVGTPATGGPVG